MTATKMSRDEIRAAILLASQAGRIPMAWCGWDGASLHICDGTSALIFSLPAGSSKNKVQAACDEIMAAGRAHRRRLELKALPRRYGAP